MSSSSRLRSSSSRFGSSAPPLLVLTWAVLAAIGLTLGLAAPASAHSSEASYLYVDVTESTLGGRVEMPFGDLRRFLGFDLRGTREQQTEELQANQERLIDYADAHLALGAGGEEWTLTFTELSQLEAESADPDFGYVQVHFVADVNAERVPRSFEVTFDPFFDDLPNERDALLLVGNDWDGGVIGNAEESLVRFAPDDRTQSVDLGDTSWSKNLAASFRLGLDHIRTGPDHMLFVAVLVLPSVLVFQRSWKPTRSFGSALWRVLKVVTMFTVAHTITFTLAALEILPLPSARIVETVIALSIAAAAVHNVKPVAANREWMIAFAFGLFHGMGFASLVSGLDVSRSTQLVSLLGRNLGIEVGQSVVVLLTFPALFLLRRTLWYRPFFLASSATLVVISLGWMAERLFDAPTVTTSLVEHVVAYPRVLGLVALFSALCAGALLVARRSDRLVPLAD